MAHRDIYDLMSIDGRVAIVVGGTGQIGNEICDTLAELGAHVVVASRTASSSKQKADEISRTHRRALGVEVDATKRKQVKQLFNSVIEEFGRLDILVNSAYSDNRSNFLELTEDEFRSAFQGGLMTTFLLAQESYPHLKDSQHPSLITIGSTYGVVSPDPQVYPRIDDMNPCHYGAIKAGVIQMTRWLAVYFAPSGIRVNCISPGAYLSDELLDVAEYRDEYVPRYRERVPLGRLGREGDLKGAVSLLASDAGNWITGQNLIVDGGWTAL